MIGCSMGSVGFLDSPTPVRAARVVGDMTSIRGRLLNGPTGPRSGVAVERREHMTRAIA